MKNAEYAQMMSDYESGMSLSEIGRKWKITRQSVQVGLARRGYAPRRTQLLAPQVFDGVKFTLRNMGYFARTDGDRELMHRYVWRFYNGDIPPGYDIHHVNHNRQDNRIENLELIRKDEHARQYNTGCNGVIHRCGK